MCKPWDLPRMSQKGERTTMFETGIIFNKSKVKLPRIKEKTCDNCQRQEYWDEEGCPFACIRNKQFTDMWRLKND
jgi:hypothetical protein